jgi:hypothetical protein
VGSSARSELLFAGAGNGEGEAMVALGIHIKFLIYIYTRYMSMRCHES